MPSTLRLNPSGAERVAFVGTTGSGKTTLAREMMAPLDRLVCVDPKGTMTGPEWSLEPDTSEAWERLKQEGGKARIRVTMPVTDRPELSLEPVFEMCYYLGGLTVYIDEMYAVTPRGRPSPYLLALYTRGREFEIGTWAATQRPMSVPLVMLSEAEWVFSFRLRLENDRKRVAEIMGPDVLRGVSEKHGFWMFNSQWEHPIYSSGLVLDGGEGDVVISAPPAAAPDKPWYRRLFKRGG